MHLTELPTEILDRICRYLSLPADIDRQGENDDDTEGTGTDLPEMEDDRDGDSQSHGYDSTGAQLDASQIEYTKTTDHAENFRRPLLDLCLVSRHLRSLAEPYPYACFDQRSDRTVPFLRHMVEHPHHAKHVLSLRIEPHMEDWQWKCVGEDLDLDLMSMLLCRMLHQATIYSGDFPSKLASRVTLNGNENQQEFIAQWLILNLPNVRVMKISLPREWSFHLLQFIAQYDHCILPYLHTLHVLDPPTWQKKYGARTTAGLDPVLCLLAIKHLDTILIDHCIDLEQYDDLGYGADRQGKAPFRVAAKHIAHWGCGQTGCGIDRLLLACTQLLSYDLEYRGGRSLDLAGLSASKDSLQSLCLDVSDLSLNSLVNCHRLEEITIMADRFDPRRPGTTRQIPTRPRVPDPPVHVLAKMLPFSLRRLRLGKSYGDAAALWQRQLDVVINHASRKISRPQVGGSVMDTGPAIAGSMYVG